MRLPTLIALAAVAAAQGLRQPAVVAPKDFAVMAWGDSPSDPEQLREMKQAGLNITGFCRVEELDRVRDAGLACFVRDARANNYDWAGCLPTTYCIAMSLHCRAGSAAIQRLSGSSWVTSRTRR